MRKMNQDGAVSLLSVLLFSLIIVIVATSFMRNIVQQQRESINYDMKARAGYAAEVGIQDAIRELNFDPTKLDTNKTTCAPYNGGSIDPATNLSYTCQLVTPAPKELTGTGLNPNKQTATVIVEPDTTLHGPYYLRISWSIPSTDRSNPGIKWVPRAKNPPGTNPPKTFPPLKDWVDPAGLSFHYHPALRINIISHARSGPLNRGNINQSVIIFNPTVQADPMVTVRNKNNKDDIDRDHLVINALCGDERTNSPVADPYYCQALVKLDNSYDLSNGGADKLYVHLASIYSKSSWRLELLPSPTGTPWNLQHSVAEIDVTGRSNDVFQRVKQVLPIKNPELIGSDAALTVGDGICKPYLLSANPGGYQPRLDVCDPNNPELP